MTGCELGGAVKNVIALAVGIAVGMGCGDNTRATLITRGLAEMTRLGSALGADQHTFAGLAGLGDLVATCNSPLSRNRTFGEMLGRGMSVAAGQAVTTQVAEGVASCGPVLELARATAWRCRSPRWSRRSCGTDRRSSRPPRCSPHGQPSRSGMGHEGECRGHSAQAAGENTRAVHLPSPPTPAQEPLGTPVYRTAAFAFGSAEYRAVLNDEMPGYSYSRIDNPTVDGFASAVAALEGVNLPRWPAAQAFASGMAAISAVFWTFARTGAHVVAPRPSTAGPTGSCATSCRGSGSRPTSST